MRSAAAQRRPKVSLTLSLSSTTLSISSTYSQRHYSLSSSSTIRRISSSFTSLTHLTMPQLQHWHYLPFKWGKLHFHKSYYLKRDMCLKHDQVCRRICNHSHFDFRRQLNFHSVAKISTSTGCVYCQAEPECG